MRAQEGGQRIGIDGQRGARAIRLSASSALRMTPEQKARVAAWTPEGM